MKICFLSSQHPPTDKRVFDKEAITLANAGFEVVHLAPGDGNTWVERGVRIVTYRKRPGLVSRALQLPRLVRLALALDADAYHCNEVDSWAAGVVIRLIRGKKCVFDVHEHYPSTFAESRFPPALRPLVSATVRGVFRVLGRFTDALVFAKRSVAPDFSGSKVRSILVQNFAQREHGSDEPPTPPAGQADTTVRLIHLGLISRMRGWPQLLDALSLIKNRKLELLVIGEFNDGSRQAFDQRATELGLSDRIAVEEWMPFKQAYQRILQSHVGLVLFQPGILNHTYALPHKMFDYMMARLPIVVPEFAEEVAPVVRESRCGLLVDPSSPRSIADALGKLIDDAGERDAMGRRGREAVLSQYNWENEGRKLIALYKEMEATA